MSTLTTARRGARLPITLEPLRVPGERPAWRPDIEGLRGLAVLLVVLYHAGVPGFQGGYVGVDVFFALSGYLITGILASEVERTGTVDLARFYARRARRLLPAAAVLLLAVTAFAYVFYSPIEQAAIAETALATAAYGSNVHFALGATDYLAAAAETNPLLHTWSLAVEEQFYLGWPLLVALGLVGLPWLRGPWLQKTRLPLSHRRLVWAMVGVSVVTFALTVYLMGTLRTHWAFFASPARAWEFAVGGLGAVLPRLRLTGERGPHAATGAHLLGWIGLTAVVGAGVAYAATTPFPGWTALVPVVGTVVALRAGVGQPTTALSRVLTWRPLREAGRLSYSWYLWHWPVLVFAEGLYGEGVGGHLSLPVRLGLLLFSLVLAEGSYRLVEDPVRHQRWLAATPRRGLALLVALTSLGIALSLAWNAVMVDIMASAPYASLVSAERDGPQRDILGANCQTDSQAPDYYECVPESTTPQAGITVFLVGDSHAEDIYPPLLELAQERGWELRAAFKPGCPVWPLTPWNENAHRYKTECNRWRERAVERVSEMHPDLVVLRGYEWYKGRGTWGGAAPDLYSDLAPAAGVILDLRTFPRSDGSPVICKARATWAGKPNSECDVPYPATNESWSARVDAALDYPNVLTVDFVASLCPGGVCPATDASGPTYRNEDHLTSRFARTLKLPIARAIDRALKIAVDSLGA